jgi:hypothetical protein
MGDFSMDEKTINMHPNDGFDLGLMTTEHVVQIHIGPEEDPSGLEDADFIHGTLHLKNDVRNGYLELSLRSAQKLGDAKKAVVHFHPGERYGKLMIVPV